MIFNSFLWITYNIPLFSCYSKLFCLYFLSAAHFTLHLDGFNFVSLIQRAKLLEFGFKVIASDFSDCLSGAPKELFFPTQSQLKLQFLGFATINAQFCNICKVIGEVSLGLWPQINNWKYCLEKGFNRLERLGCCLREKTSSCFPAVPVLGNSRLVGFLSRSTCLHCSQNL